MIILFFVNLTNECPFYVLCNLLSFNFYQVETSGLYNHEEDENFRQDADDVVDGDDDDTVLNTRGLVTEHNKKKKKSGGFQSMGKLCF